uniref:Uncharacterized protein n=1 Tax=Anguilla anguilla TaxID=7936 RepID=A0A0E9RMX5_ANGAN
MIKISWRDAFKSVLLHCSLLRMNRRPILSRDVNNTDF